MHLTLDSLCSWLGMAHWSLSIICWSLGLWSWCEWESVEIRIECKLHHLLLLLDLKIILLWCIRVWVQMIKCLWESLLINLCYPSQHLILLNKIQLLRHDRLMLWPWWLWQLSFLPTTSCLHHSIICHGAWYDIDNILWIRNILGWYWLTIIRHHMSLTMRLGSKIIHCIWHRREWCCLRSSIGLGSILGMCNWRDNKLLVHLPDVLSRR